MIHVSTSQSSNLEASGTKAGPDFWKASTVLCRRISTVNFGLVREFRCAVSRGHGCPRSCARQVLGLSGGEFPTGADDANRSRTVRCGAAKLPPKGPKANSRLEEHEQAVRQDVAGEQASTSEAQESFNCIL